MTPSRGACRHGARQSPRMQAGVLGSGFWVLGHGEDIPRDPTPMTHDPRLCSLRDSFLRCGNRIVECGVRGCRADGPPRELVGAPAILEGESHRCEVAAFSSPSSPCPSSSWGPPPVPQPDRRQRPRSRRRNRPTCHQSHSRTPSPPRQRRRPPPGRAQRLPPRHPLQLPPPGRPKLPSPPNPPGPQTLRVARRVKQPGPLAPPPHQWPRRSRPVPRQRRPARV